MALERELAYFNQRRFDWVREHEGKFALIVGDTLEGFFETAEEAYIDAVSRHGNIPMLIREVLVHDTPVQMPVFVLLGHGHADLW